MPHRARPHFTSRWCQLMLPLRDNCSFLRAILTLRTSNTPTVRGAAWTKRTKPSAHACTSATPFTRDPPGLSRHPDPSPLGWRQPLKFWERQSDPWVEAQVQLQPPSRSQESALSLFLLRKSPGYTSAIATVISSLSITYASCQRRSEQGPAPAGTGHAGRKGLSAPGLAGNRGASGREENHRATRAGPAFRVW